jgi:hypothetical protein
VKFIFLEEIKINNLLVKKKNLNLIFYVEEKEGTFIGIR